MTQQQFGIIGLGVMGQNLALNMARNGVHLVGYDRSATARDKFATAAAAGKQIKVVASMGDFMNALTRPRHILLMIPAGAPLYASKICAYAQGMSLLRAASNEYGYDLDLAVIARIWRAGCIIRADLLDDIARVFTQDAALPNLLLDSEISRMIAARQDGWRYVAATAVSLGIPMLATAASLSYFDSYRSARLPANLIQAQRDYFGAHTFERTDRPGLFHHDWHQSGSTG
jgi:6-phosphogluconate dehydrogenase